MTNAFVHVELHTQDPDTAKKFYKELFDWKLENVPDMNYTIVNVGEGTGGGIMNTVHTFWTMYASVCYG
ncbi:MAG: VOC family protein [Syntrophobacteraceae bacterium]